MTDSPSRPPKIRIRGLCKAFGSHQVLRGVDLDIEEGRSMVIIGGSGTGKSILLRCIMGLVVPDAGSIEIDGIDLLGCPPPVAEALRAQIGMLFQNGALFDSMSIGQNMLFALDARPRISALRRSLDKSASQRRNGIEQADALARDLEAHPASSREEALQLLEQVGLDGELVFPLSPSELSGGMQKRVGLARAIAVHPRILFLDEPTTGLDPITSSAIDSLIADSVKSLKGTALAITHDMASAQRIGADAAMLYDGKIIWSGPTRRLMDSDNPIVNQFTHGNLKGPIPTRFNISSRQTGGGAKSGKGQELAHG